MFRVGSARASEGDVITEAIAPKLYLGHIGTTAVRVDGIPKVTGEFAFSSDLQAAGMLWGHTLRSPYAHARICAIDLSEAVAMPGVHAVLTHEDVPARSTTAASSGTSRCSPSTASATSESP